MSDDATLPYSPTQDDDYHSSLDHQHESPEISGTMDHDPTESGEKGGTIESEESKSIGPFHSSRSLNSADSESTRGSVLIGPMLASRDRENYPYGNHYQMQPKKHQSSGSIEEDDKIYFGIEYHDAAAVAKAIKSNNGIVSRLTIDTEPIPVMGKGSGKREPMFVNKDNDRKAEELLESKGDLFAKEEDRTHENMMEGSDHRRRAAYEADQAKQAYGVKKLENKRYFSAPNPQDGPSRQAMAMMKEGPKKRRHSEDTLGGDFGLGLGGSLGRALKEIDQPAKMRRYSTQSTMFLEEQSGDSEGIEQHLSFSDPSGQFSSFERQQYTDDNEDDRPRQASPAKSEASDVAAENKLIDVQVFGSYDFEEPEVEDQQTNQDKHTKETTSSPPPSSSQQETSNNEKIKGVSSSSTPKYQPIAQRLRRHNPRQDRISVTYSSTVKEDAIFKKWKQLIKSSVYPTISEPDKSDWYQCTVMVFKVDPSTKKPAPTAKYIYARLAEKPIVSMEWLRASVEANKILDIADYRIPEVPVQNHVLRGKSIYFAIQRLNDEDALYKQTYQRPLVNALQGKLLRKEPLEPNANTVVIVDAGSASATKFQERGITIMTRDELRALVQ